MLISTGGEHMTAKRRLLATILILSLPMVPAALAADDLAIGDTLEVVQSALGEPRGSIKAGSYQLLQFERGRVEFRDGVVIRLNIVSADIAEARRIRREKEQEARRVAAAERRAQRHAEGLNVRDRARSNENFDQLSGREQLDFWSSFRRQYPGISVDVEYASARARDRRETEQRRNDRRLADMDRRIAEADARAREAEAQADDLAEDLKRQKRRSYVTYATPYAPVYQQPVTYRTPVRKISYVSRPRYAPHITRTTLGGNAHRHDEELDRERNDICSTSSSYVTYRYPTFSQYNGTSHSRITVGY
jgi:hypothetical protein